MKKVGIALLVALGIGLLVGLNYALFSGWLLGLPPEVRSALRSDRVVDVFLEDEDSRLMLIPSGGELNTGLIMFPEGNMDIRTYAPIGQGIARRGYAVVFLSRRLETGASMAEENARIEALMADYPQIKRWVVGGHTWGAQVGARYAADYPDRVAGVVLWGARLSADSSLAGTDLPVLMVYGTLDDQNVDLLANNRPWLPEHTVFAPIEGGNRVRFASFGPMAADIGATISPEEQQAQAAAITVEFLMESAQGVY
jgi:pimeloyl-ACP methyl ester carboxylesterase